MTEQNLSPTLVLHKLVSEISGSRIPLLASSLGLFDEFNKISCENSAEKLKELKSDLKNINAKKEFFDCLPQNPWQKFCGRVNELAKLESLFLSTRRLALLTGIGGIGKSSLVRGFAKKNQIKRHCLMFRAEDSSSLQDDIYELGKRQGVSARFRGPQFCNVFSRVKRKNPVYVLEMCIQKIRSRHDAEFLIILDNVRDSSTQSLAMIIISSLRKFKDVYICVTTRENRLISGRDIVYLSISELDIDSALQFVREELPYESKSEVLKLCKRLNNFPLGLKQAIGYLKHQRQLLLEGNCYQIKDFIQDLNIRPERVFERNYDACDTRTLLTIWDASLKEVWERPNEEPNCSARLILEALSLVGPDGIEIKILVQLIFGELEDSKSLNLSVKRCLEFLKSLSLIRAENNIISIHRLVQEIVRIKNDQLANTIQRVSCNVVGLVQRHKTQTIVLVHVKSIWKNITKTYNYQVPYGDIAKSISQRMFKLKEYDNCAKFSKKAIQFLELDSSADCAIVTELELMLGVSSYLQNDFVTAADSLNKVEAAAHLNPCGLELLSCSMMELQRRKEHLQYSNRCQDFVRTISGKENEAQEVFKRLVNHHSKNGEIKIDTKTLEQVHETNDRN